MTSKQLSLFTNEDFVEEKKGTCIIHSHYNHQKLFQRLSESTFRSGFHLSESDIAYIDKKGIDTIEMHAIDFIKKRLAPASIPNDGKQTPMRGHPVFLAQHATGCCCRGCLYKWHHIRENKMLSEEEQRYIVSVIMTWIRSEYARR